MNEIELLNRMRDEVPEQQDLRGVERALARRTAGPAPMPARRPVYRLRLGLTAAGACALAVAATAVATSGGGNVQPPVATTTRPAVTKTVLERAALVAGRSTAQEIRPDQWFYLKESQHMGGGLPTFEHWSRMDGGRTALRQEGGELKVGPPEKGPTDVTRTQREVEALPTDPDALVKHFRGLETARTPLSVCAPMCPPEIADDVKVFGAIGWYMKFGPMIPPDTRAAMYRALAKLRHVSVEENATDMDGRAGVGVVFDAGAHGKSVYILDSGDYRYMGVKSVDDGAAIGMSVLGAGIVDNAGDLP
ncbi:hypothetical protein E1267_36795 [Nonomuraea longispora]|uniref:CU044_5270 family protein n=1 Tax=Nonomuraea longispora TaxID=1848320 RepID=A0A4R4MYD7_9ACTN|nr:CU044_5270 family protein [Nonomuraea longispora]TDB99692.1 hypothetical protein E1267_36795 [Nonomuraea longispora]